MSEPNDAQLDVIFFYGAYPLWQFLSTKFDIDIREVCPRVAKDVPKLATELGEYVVEVVEPDYSHGLNTHESDVHDSHITFLLNCVNVVFNMLKEGIIRDGEHILYPYAFQLDSNQNLELVLAQDASEYISELSSCKLGIRFSLT